MITGAGHNGLLQGETGRPAREAYCAFYGSTVAMRMHKVTKLKSLALALLSPSLYRDGGVRLAVWP